MASRRAGSFDIPTSQPNAYQGPMASPTKPAFHSNVLDRLHHYANTADNKLSEIGAPLNPYLSTIGRILVVMTFFEDAWRICRNWHVQVDFVWKFRGLPWIITELFFITSVFLMITCSILIIIRKRLLFGVSSLIGVIVVQALAYRVFDLHFWSRALSLTGGLLLVVSDVFAQEKRRLPGLPEIDSKDRSQNFILVGRSLIVVLFLSHLLRTKWTVSNITINSISIISCILLVVGYKARFSASVLAVMLLLQNFVLNSYWNPNKSRDYMRYEHFQVLSIVGGLIMVVKLGAGKLSFDEKRKIY